MHIVSPTELLTYCFCQVAADALQDFHAACTALAFIVILACGALRVVHSIELCKNEGNSTCSCDMHIFMVIWIVASVQARWLIQLGTLEDKKLTVGLLRISSYR